MSSVWNTCVSCCLTRTRRCYHVRRNIRRAVFLRRFWKRFCATRKMTALSATRAGQHRSWSLPPRHLMRVFDTSVWCMYSSTTLSARQKYDRSLNGNQSEPSTRTSCRVGDAQRTAVFTHFVGSPGDIAAQHRSDLASGGEHNVRVLPAGGRIDRRRFLGDPVCDLGDPVWRFSCDVI